MAARRTRLPVVAGLFGVLILIVALVYSSWRMFSREYVCPRCGAPNMIPLYTPRALEIKAQRAAEQQPPAPVEPEAEDESPFRQQRRAAPAMHEHFITAQHGALTYRVLAPRTLSEQDLRQAVWQALQDGRLAEPQPGQTATLVLRD